MPRPLQTDTETWRRLAAAATQAVDHPTKANEQALHRAAKAARKAVMPLGHRYPGSLFSKLIGQAAAYPTGAAVDLTLLAHKVNAVLDGRPPPGSDPPRAFEARKDIFG